VGSLELAKQLGNVTYVIGTGRAADRQKTLDFGAHEFADLDCSSKIEHSRIIASMEAAVTMRSVTRSGEAVRNRLSRAAVARYSVVFDVALASREGC
jgi:hypothetical protein